MSTEAKGKDSREPDMLRIDPLTNPSRNINIENMNKFVNTLYRENIAPLVAENRNGAVATPGAYYFMPDFTETKSERVVSGYSERFFDVHSIRKDFPILHRRVNGKALIWLDNAATTQKPSCVIDSLNEYYRQYNSNVHRGAHTLATIASKAYDDARKKVQKFLGAASEEEIIFVRGTTEAINLVAQSYGKTNIQSGDEILLTQMEHHSDIVPWQILAREMGAKVKAASIDDYGQINLASFKNHLSPRTRIVALTHVSNVLGTVNPIHEMITIAHKHGACVLIDGAQAVAHMDVNVRDLDADFYAFSGHKIYGPTGIGVLYGKSSLLEHMPPWQGGGGMIKDVSLEDTTYNSLPHKFEAGTGNIADAVGLATALDYLKSIGMDDIERYEKHLTSYAMEKLACIPGLKLIGTAPNKTSVLSFVMDGIAPDNIAQHLNRDGIALRAGHHCAQPALKRYGLASCARASLGIYNTKEEVDFFADSVLSLARYFVN